MSIERVAFIGLGAMGAPLARRLIQAGYEMAVYDCAPEAMAQFAHAGARQAASPADAAREAGAVITVTPDSEDVEAAILGRDGAIEGAKKNCLFIEMSTIDPAVTRKVAACLKERGARMIDAPICRSTDHAEQGKVMFVVGGDEKDYAEAKPILEHLGDTFHYCGPIGSGITMKVINNMMGQTISVAVAETLTLGVKAGLDFEQMVQVLAGTAVRNSIMVDAFPSRAFKGDFSLGFALDWAHKDVGHALTMAAREKAFCPMAAEAHQVLSMAQAQGKGRMDASALVTVFEEIAKVSLRSSRLAEMDL